MAASSTESLDGLSFSIDDITIDKIKPSPNIFQLVKIGDLSELKCLTDNGKFISIEDSYGLGALLEALVLDKNEIVKFIVETLSKQPRKKILETFFLMLVETDETVELAHKLFELIKTISNGQFIIYSIFKFAISQDHIAAINLLLKYGVKSEMQNPEKMTLLHQAARSGSCKVIQILVRTDAALEVKDIRGDTSLHEAARWGRVDAVEVLLSAGADARVKNQKGNTVLHVATSSIIAAEFCTHLTALVRFKHDDEEPLASMGYITTDSLMKIAKKLLASGADINAQNNNGNTILHKAINLANIDVAKFLIKLGADINIKNNSGISPVMLAGNEAESLLKHFIKTRLESTESEQLVTLEPEEEAHRVPISKFLEYLVTITSKLKGPSSSHQHKLKSLHAILMDCIDNKDRSSITLKLFNLWQEIQLSSGGSQKPYAISEEMLKCSLIKLLQNKIFRLTKLLYLTDKDALSSESDEDLLEISDTSADTTSRSYKMSKLIKIIKPMLKSQAKALSSADAIPGIPCSLFDSGSSYASSSSSEAGGSSSSASSSSSTAVSSHMTLFKSEKKRPTKPKYVQDILLFGDTRVGVSSLIRQHLYGGFNDVTHTSYGAEWEELDLPIGDLVVKQKIFDLTAEDRVRRVRRCPLFEVVHTFFLCFDRTNTDSFDKLLYMWLPDIQFASAAASEIILVGTKSDLHEACAVTDKCAQEFADSKGIRYFKTSAKLNENIHELFLEAARKFLKSKGVPIDETTVDIGSDIYSGPLKLIS